MAQRWLTALFKRRADRDVVVPPEQKADEEATMNMVQAEAAAHKASWELIDKAKDEDLLADAEGTKLQHELDHCKYQIHLLNSVIARAAMNRFIQADLERLTAKRDVYFNRMIKVEQAITNKGGSPWIRN